MLRSHNAPRLGESAALDRHEARTKALEARKVLVAGRLVDRALAPKLGFERLHREAIGLNRTVAATFAHPVVDDHAPRRIGRQLAASATAQLGRAGLLVNDDRDSGHPAQLALHGFELVTVEEPRAGREVGDRELLGRIANYHDVADRFAVELVGDLRDTDRPVYRLAAGHGDRVII